MSEETTDNTGPDTLKIEQVSLAETDQVTKDEPAPKTDKQKIDVLLKATGNAPIMKQKKWTVDQEKKVGSVVEFIKKYLGLDSTENLVRITMAAKKYS
ncbi:hypothetical protein RUM44_010715 [Polyplax serrata]|uniref:Ubiquitin-like protein ATG12 n=1 Tax=Polyplax serrata TaxID=468196 RepID=A0ABR1AN03_POLSC